MDVSPPTAPEQAAPQPRPPSAILRWPHFAAIAAGVVLAVLVSSIGGKAGLWGKVARSHSPQTKSSVSGVFSDRDLDRQMPQKHAEVLLERAVSSSDEPAAYAEAKIGTRIEAWRGKLKMDKQLGELTTVALNSSDYSLRASAIEVQLAAYGLSKNESTVDAVVRQTDSSDHAQKIWALWTLGLLGNRGVQTDRVLQVLVAHLKYSSKNSDEDARRWAVEGLALLGSTSTIVPL